MKGRIIKKRKCIRRIQKNEGKVMRIKKDGRKGGGGAQEKKNKYSYKEGKARG